MGSLMRNPVLQLNNSFEPLRIIPVRRALVLLSKGKATVEVHSDKEIYPCVFLPVVIRLKEYRHVPIRMQIVSRKNIYMRDQYKCQYCGERFRSEDLTLDHIIPRAQGGRSTWENLVACCRRDNHRKADRTPEQASMKLIRRPLPANIHTSRFILKAMGSEVKEWAPYLYHDSAGDERFVAR